MKHRVTYLLPQDTGLDRSDITVSGTDSLVFGKAAQAAQEWRFTLGLDELPDELQVFLQASHELHIKSVAPRPDERISPLVSRLPPGVHVFYTPQSAEDDVTVCKLLQKMSGTARIKCNSVADSFTRPRLLSERFANAASYQYFARESLIDHLADAFLSKACAGNVASNESLDACNVFTTRLANANYVDVDFDIISHALTMTAYWSATSWTRSLPATSQSSLRKVTPDDRLEVGVLQVEPADEPEELKLGGYLTVIGQDDRPDATLFSFPSRHHSLPAGDKTTFKVSFQQPTGLHPKLAMEFPLRNLIPPKDSCALHSYLTLPSELFIDRYSFSDQLFLQSHNLVALHTLSGEDDLEAPEWVVKRWGSAALLELAHPHPEADGVASNSPWTITIPMHLRYLNGSAFSTDEPGSSTLEVPWPVVFWACEAQEGLKMATNPFDRVNLGYDGLFGPKTMFYHVPAAPAVRAVEKITVPVLDVAGAAWVPLGTLAVVAVGFAWICWRLLRTVETTGTGESKKRR